jgi:hypothetical protein
VTEVAATPVERPDDELALTLEAGIQARPIVFLARLLVLIEPGWLNTGDDQRIALEFVGSSRTPRIGFFIQSTALGRASRGRRLN